MLDKTEEELVEIAKRVRQLLERNNIHIEDEVMEAYFEKLAKESVLTLIHMEVSGYTPKTIAGVAKLFRKKVDVPKEKKNSKSRNIKIRPESALSGM